jgi:hypothetical protein
MTHDEHLNEHLELCKRIYERMKRENSWPWLENGEQPDSPNSDGMIDSKDK